MGGGVSVGSGAGSALLGSLSLSVSRRAAPDSRHLPNTLRTTPRVQPSAGPVGLENGREIPRPRGATVGDAAAGECSGEEPARDELEAERLVCPLENRQHPGVDEQATHFVLFCVAEAAMQLHRFAGDPLG